MARYTVTIKSLIDNNFDFGLNDTSSYPIFDEAYRNTLNTKILNHYYLDEIGLETPALFRNRLLARLKEIMPYYNTLYENQLDKIDNLLGNVDLHETMDRDYTKSENNTNNTTTSGNSTSSSTSNNKNLFQNTPQGRIAQTDIDSQTWATNVTFDRGTINDTSTTSGTSNATNTQTGSSTDDYIKHITGNNGKKYNIELIEELRKGLLNIDLMIIDELYDLFMGLIS